MIGVPGGWSSGRLVDAVKQKTGFGILVDMERVVIDLEEGRAFCDGVDLTTLDALMIKKIGKLYSPDLLDRLAMLRFVNGRGVRIFSDPFRIKRVLDRLSCTVTLRLGDIPMPPTTVTESEDEALAWVERYGRAVLKPLFTSKARGMRVVQAGSDARAKLVAFREAGNEIFYIQKMLELPGRDLGVAFLGGEFLGCYARRGDGQSWNTTTRSGGKYEPFDPGDDVLEVAHKAQSLFGLDFTCVDIAETDEGPVVFEVSAFGGFRGLLEANHIDAAERYTDYVLNRLSDDQ